MRNKWLDGVVLKWVDDQEVAIRSHRIPTRVDSLDFPVVAGNAFGAPRSSDPLNWSYACCFWSQSEHNHALSITTISSSPRPSVCYCVRTHAGKQGRRVTTIFSHQVSPPSAPWLAEGWGKAGGPFVSELQERSTFPMQWGEAPWNLRRALCIPSLWEGGGD